MLEQNPGLSELKKKVTLWGERYCLGTRKGTARKIVFRVARTDISTPGTSHKVENCTL